jgi:uncharacterized protein YdeI (YjbR/CyaY-like superfamily)
MATSKHDLYPVMEFRTSALFEKWLAKHHAKEPGVWLKIAKAKSGIETVSQQQALDVVLCYGWIDGLRRSFDENYFLQKYTPRTEKSIWSVINKKKVAALIKAGRMKPAGVAAIEAAKKDGRWQKAYDSSTNMSVPADLQKALNGNKKAKAFFAKLSAQNRFAILFRIHHVKKAETRARKIESFVAMLERNETIYPQKLTAARG